MAELERTLADIEEEFALLPDWEERIAFLLDQAKTLEPLSDAERNDATRVRGCASKVWLVNERRPGEPDKLFFRGDSDAHIVRGEIALLLRIFSGRTPQEILSVDPRALFDRLGLKEALTMQRSNGLFAMMDRIRLAAAAAA
ncbi:MAG TPA: SufE family protein [Vitreimonas sp.]|jgi:cysteine desulfuration protein SufE|nr:SufE family protein [Vitreimonas sp.]